MKRFKNTVSAPKKSQRFDDLQVLREAGLLEEDGVALSEPKKDDLDILRAAGLLEEKPSPPLPAPTIKEDKSDDITKKQLNDIEKYADRIFRAVGIDVEFTRHFLDRVNDSRNKKQITPAELIRLFKQSYKKYGKKISKLGAEAQAVINDMRTDINMPFVLEPKGNELELIAKTVMRKKDFKTSNPKLSFESYTKGDTVTTDDALVLKEESLDDFKHPKIEDRPVENVEGDWKNLAVPSPSPNSSEDTLKELLLSQKLGKSRTEEQEKSVLNHDSSAAYAVKQYMDANKLSYDKKEFEKVIEAGRGVGRFYKNKFQRPRPWELAEKLNINIHHMEFPSDSMDSPAYPSNHSLQSRLVAEYYAQMYPQHRAQLIKAAEESGVGRVRAGWHYNSDHKAGGTLAEQLVKMINIKTKSTEEFTNILENYQEVLEDAKEKEFNYKLESTLKTLEQQEVSKAASFITEGAPPKEPEKSTEEKLQEQIESLSNLKRDLPNMMATTAGGGSIYLYDLDDVDESTRQDGYFLKYRASDQKYIGEASGVTSEQIQDVVGGMVTSNTETGITVVYQDGDGTLDFTIGTLNQDTTGTAAIATTVTITDNESTDEDNALIFTAGGDVDGGNLGLESDGTLTYNPSTGKVTATGFVGTLTGNVTGNVSGSAGSATGNAATATALASARTIGGVSFDGTANINLPGVNASGTQDTSGTAATATLATTVTVSDSTANTNFPVVFHNESNALLDDTGALRYNPSTGELLVPKLTVAGTTTTVDTVTMEASNAIIFEGATADSYETTFTITDPTADRTITLPNVSGTVSLITATETLTNKTLTSPVLNTPTVGTSITPASDDGATLGTSSLNWSDIYLADGAIINFGDDQDVVLTHIHNTGLRLNDGDKLNFGTSDDLSIYHDGNNSALTHSGTGDFYVQADNFYFRTSSTSENAITTTLNGAVTLYHNANAKLTTSATGVSVTGDVIASGTVEPAGDTAAGDDAAIGYTAAEGLILTGQGSTSDITVKNDADATVFTVPTGTDDILFPDDAKAMWGTGSDLQIYHDGSNSHIKDTGTGALKIASSLFWVTNPAGSESIIYAAEDSGVNLYHNGTKMLECLLNAVGILGEMRPLTDDGATLGSSSYNWSDLYLADGAVINFGDDQDVVLTHVADTGIRLNDSDKMLFGTDADSEIYHNGSNFYISNDTGNALLYSDTFQFFSHTGSELFAQFNHNAAVNLYYDSAKKFETTSAGISVTGSGIFTGNSLQVGDNNAAGGDYDSVLWLLGDSSSGFKIGVNAANSLLTIDREYNGWQANQLTMLRSNGNIGIGTAAPSEKLHVVDGGGSDAEMILETSTNSTGARIHLKSPNAAGANYHTIGSLNSSTANWRIGGSGTADTIDFQVGSGNTQIMRVNSSGADFYDKTVTRLNLKDYGEVTSALGSAGGARTINLQDGNSFSATVSSSTVTWTFSNPTASDELCGFTLVLVNGGSQTVNWPASVDWAGGTAPTLTTSGTDILVFSTIDGGTIWHGMVASADTK